MVKFFIGLFLSATLLNAGLVNAIALKINDEPITLFDIDEKMMQKGITKDEAVGILIEETLYDQQIKKYNINIDAFELRAHLEKIAASNGMDLHTFKSVIRQKFGNIEVFEAQTKEKMKRDKLMSKIVKGNLKYASDDDLKIYYDNNPDKFNIANILETVIYTSKSSKELQAFKSNPMLVSKNIKQENKTFTQKDLNPQMKYLLNDTKEGKFTPIVRLGNEFGMIYIVKKSDMKVMSFDEVKNMIFETVMKERERQYLKEYFNKLKINADIEVIR